MDRLIKRTFIGTALFLVFGLTGCQSLKTPEFKLPFLSDNRDKDEKDAKPEMEGVLPPQDIVALWTNTVHTVPGKPQTRGMAARLYFYDKNRKTVPVDGGLIVYGYNDSIESKKQPDRKYVFNTEQLASHYSESEFGPSYSVWIPWDQVGSPQKDISLVPVFKAADGQTVMGEHTQHVLPGPKSEATARTQSLGRHQLASSSPASTSGNNVQLATYQGGIGSNVGTIGGVQVFGNSVPEPTKLRATSINLPPAVRTRLASNSGMQLGSGRSQVNIASSRVAASPPDSFSYGQASNGQSAFRARQSQAGHQTIGTGTSANQVVEHTAASRPGTAAPAGVSTAAAAGTQNLVQMAPNQQRPSTLDRIRAKASLEKAQQTARFAPATRQAQAWPTQRQPPHRPQTQPNQTGWQSAPAW